MVTREEAAHALVGQPFAFEVRGGLLTVHTSASVKGEQWKQRWQQCMRDVQRGDAVCVEAIQATHMFGGDAYHLLHVRHALLKLLQALNIFIRAPFLPLRLLLHLPLQAVE